MTRDQNISSLPHFLLNCLFRLSYALAILALLMTSRVVLAACSSDVGGVVFNELRNTTSGTKYLELRLLNPDVLVSSSNFLNWNIAIYNGTTLVTTTSLNTIFTDSNKNTCGVNSPWILIPDASMGNVLNLYGGNNLNFVLYDNSSGTKKIVDVLRMGSQSNLYTPGTTFDSCSTIDSNFTTKYGMDWGSNGNKNWYRTLDGIGTWSGTATSGNANSICGDNNGTAPAQVGLNKTASSTSVNLNTNFNFTLYAQNPLTGTTKSNVAITDNLTTAGLTFVSCTATSPDTCTNSGNTVTFTVSSLPTNSTRSAVLTVYSSSTGIKTNTITASGLTGTPTASTSVTILAIPPTVSTLTATSVSSNTANLNGSVNPNGTTSTVSFGYSSNTGSYTSTCTPTTSSFSGSTSQNFTCSLSGLSCDTTYYYRAQGSNTGGVANGAELNFTTPTCASGFDAFETSLLPSTAKIYTKLTGTAFNLKVAALNGTTVQSGYTGTVTVDLISGTASCVAGTTALSGVTLSPTSHAYVSGDAGVYTYSVTSTKANSNVKVRMKDATGVISCSTDNFAIRPSSFTITSTDATNTGTSGSPTIKAGANFNLTATAIAGYSGTPVINNGAGLIIGTPTQGSISGSFGAATSSTGIATGSTFTYSDVGNVGLAANAVYDSSFTSIDQSSDCTNDFSTTLVGGKYGCKIGSSAVSQTTGSSGFGRFIPDHFGVTTKGSISAGSNLLIMESTAVSALISTGATLTIAGAGPAGATLTTTVSAVSASSSIITLASPATLSVTNAGIGGISVLQNRADLSPTASSSFTYMDEPMKLSLKVIAYNATEEITKNYADSYAKLDATTLGTGSNWFNTGCASTAQCFGLGAVNGTATGLSNRLSIYTDLPLGVPTSNWTAGVGSFVAYVKFKRNAIPDGPYQSLYIGAMPQDSDGVTLPGSTASDDAHKIDFDATTSNTLGSNPDGTNERRQLFTTDLRFGRLRLSNVFGTGSLKMPVTVQYWKDSSWLLNSDDSQSVVVLGAISPASGSVAASCVSTPINYCSGTDLKLTNGQSYIKLTSSTPSAISNVCAELGGVGCTATLTSYSYLQGKWPPGSDYSNDPIAKATFGIHAPETKKTVHVREQY